MKLFPWLAPIATLALTAGSGAACSASDGGGTGRASTGGSGGGAAFGGTGASAGSLGFGGVGGVGGGTGAIGGLNDGGECAAVAEQAENGYAPIDIIWAIDNSGSMTFEAQEVQNNMNNFATEILSHGLDIHVVIISEDGPPNPFGGSNGVCIPPPLGSGGPCTNAGDSNPPTYLRVPWTVQSTDSLRRLLEFYPKYKQVLRKKSLKYFAVVTDDESDMDAYTFIQSVGALDPGWFDSWKFFGVFCDGSFCGGFPPPCETPGAIYADSVSQTGGVQGSLCQGQSNFGGVFQALATTISQATELACEWEIPPVPAGQLFDKGLVNVRYTPSGGGPAQDLLYVGDAASCGPGGGWYYDDEANPKWVQVCQVNCDQMKHDDKGTVEVLFGCYTVTAPK